MTYDLQRPFSPWFFAVAHRAAIDHSRRRKTRATVEFHEGMDLCHPSTVDAAVLQMDLENITKRLDAQCRRYYRLWRQEGGRITLDEAASKLGVSRSTVFNIKLRLFRSLREAYLDGEEMSTESWEL